MRLLDEPCQCSFRRLYEAVDAGLQRQVQGFSDMQVCQINKLQQGVPSLPVHYARLRDGSCALHPLVLRHSVEQQIIAAPQRRWVHAVENDQAVRRQQARQNVRRHLWHDVDEHPRYGGEQGFQKVVRLADQQDPGLGRRGGNTVGAVV